METLVSHLRIALRVLEICTVGLVQFVDDQMSVSCPGIIQARQDTDAPQQRARIAGQRMEIETID